MNVPLVTISMPCFGRPLRTRRAIKSIIDQTITAWEAFILGDGCPDYELLMQQKVLDDPRIIAKNLSHSGAWGTSLTNQAITNAIGKYFVFMANDDYIEPTHLESYLSQIDGTDFDFVYFNCYYPVPRILKIGNYSINKISIPKTGYGSVGHSSFIINTAFLKTVRMHMPEYGQDFTLFNDMIKSGARYKKAKGIKPTYHVMTDSSNRIDPGFID